MSRSKSKMEIGLKRILSGILTFMLVFTSVPFAGFTTHAEDDPVIYEMDGEQTGEALKEIIRNAKDGDGIKINGKVCIDSQVTIDKSINLWGKGTLYRNKVASYTYMLYINNNATVTMNDITIDGSYENPSSLSAAVYIEKGVTFTMYDVTIKNNNSTHFGGVRNSGTFIMKGGQIKNNKSLRLVGGGGVYNEGTFKMTGGEISQNKTDSDGGGVYNKGTFEMSGGEISGNTAVNGGGVYNEGTFKIFNGTVSNNKAKNGGGVYNGYGTVTMTEGTISGNTAIYGGGVYNDNGTLTMSVGTISKNTSNYGGGIYNEGGTLTMSVGTISKNTSNYGGGVCNSGTFKMSGGEISGNTAVNGGGVDSFSGTFEMAGGTISGNTATESGGGVYLDGGKFKVQGAATISGNGENNNVRFSSANRYITVTDKFSGLIGLKQNFYDAAVRAGDGYTLTQDDLNCFAADDSNAHLEYMDGKLIYAKNRTEWGQMVQNNGVTYYVDENGRVSAEVVGNGKIWLNTKSDGSGSWYCIDNSQGTFKIGSRFYIQVIDDISKYYDKIGSEYRDKIEDGKLKIFLIGVTDPDGKEYTNLDTEINCYVKVNPNWDKDKIKAIFINGEKTEKVDIEYMGLLKSPSNGDKFIKLTLKHFSPYAIYQAKSEDNALDTFATGENVNYGYILGLSTMAIAALAGVMFIKRKFNK